MSVGFLFIVTTVGMTFYGLPEEFFGPGGIISCPTILVNNQLNNFVDFKKFGKNYSLVLGPPLCGEGAEAPPSAPGSAFTYLNSQNYGPGYFSCKGSSTIAKTAEAAGYQSVIMEGFFNDYYWLLRYATVQSESDISIPVVVGGNPNDIPFLPTELTGGCSGVPFFFPLDNVTFAIEYPSPNSLWSDMWNYNGGGYNIMWIGFSFNLILIVLVAFKTGQQFSLDGFAVSIPKLVFIQCFFVGAVGIVNSLANLGVSPTVLYQAGVFFHYLGYVGVYGCLLIFSLYFGEIAQLTSAPSQGFSWFKVPVIISEIGLYTVALLFCFLYVFTKITTTALVTGSFVNASVIVYLVIALFAFLAAAVLAVCVYGTIVLTKAVWGTQKFASVFTIIILIDFSCVLVIIISLMDAVIWNGVFDVFAPTSILWSLSVFQLHWMILSFQVFVPAACCILFCFVFRTTIQKEIEISKSGTSSTSSSSSSSSSRSATSSSSRNDPVIEL